MNVLALIWVFICLFVSILSFQIRFVGNQQVAFPPSFLKYFQLPSVENIKTAGYKDYYLPFTLNDFTIFLYRLRSLNPESSEENEQSKLFHLHQYLKKEPFFDTHFKTNKTALWELLSSLDEASLYYSSDLQMQGKARFELYSEFWENWNYLYPFCLSEHFTIKNGPIGVGEHGKCYQIEPSKVPSGTCSVKIPASAVFKKLSGHSFVDLEKYGFKNVVDLSELQLNLFSSLHHCTNIHLLLGLVISSANNADSNVDGFISERAEYGTLGNFVAKHRFFGNYGSFMAELLHVAEAIHFMHQKRLAHADIHVANILVFSNNTTGITLKLSDLGKSCTFEDYLTRNKAKIDEAKRRLLKTKFDLANQPSFELRLVVRNDWRAFGEVLKIIVPLTGSSDYERSTIKPLVEFLTTDAYWDSENPFNAVQLFFSNGIKANESVVPFTFEPKPYGLSNVPQLVEPK